MTLATWSISERIELTKLLHSLETIHRKASKLQAQFDERHWPPEIAIPLMNLKFMAARAVDAVYKERGRK